MTLPRSLIDRIFEQITNNGYVDKWNYATQAAREFEAFVKAGKVLSPNNIFLKPSRFSRFNSLTPEDVHTLLYPAFIECRDLFEAHSARGPMNENKRRLKVFLCHAHSDEEAVHDLFRYLRREGVDAWLDKEKLLPGSDWEREIRKAVRESDVVVVCLSQDFNKAGFRQKEVRLALDAAMYQVEGEVFIIPGRLEVCDVPESLSKWQWVNLFEDGGRQKLIYALRARAESVGAALRRRRGDASGKSTSRSA
jgi:hypothetical protein